MSRSVSPRPPIPEPAGATPPRPWVGLTVLLAGFLLFVAELHAGERLLPRLGGGPVVWVSTVVMFQLLLVLAYAAGLARGRWNTLAIGFVLLAVAGSGLGGSAPAEGPLALLVPWIAGPGLLVLAFAAATTLPHLLRSYGPDQAATVRRLVALSNLGAFVGLAAGVALQQSLDLPDRAVLLRVAAAVLGVLFLLVGRRAVADRPPAETSRAGAGANAWRLGAAAAAGVLWYVSVHARLEAATLVSPVLWAATLGAYLATWVLAFRLHDRFASGVVAAGAASAGVGIALALTIDASAGPLSVLRPIVGGILAIGVGCLAAHLAARRFYLRSPSAALASLWTAIGGAVGGLLALLAAPLVTTTTQQLAGAAAVLIVTCGLGEGIFRRGRWTLRLTGLLGLVGAVAIVVVPSRAERDGEVLRTERSWLGEFSIVAYDQHLDRYAHRVLFSAGTIHGAQYTDPSFIELPVAYYSMFTGVGRGLRALQDLRGAEYPARIGAVGLGSGVIAAYIDANDTVRFHELDPVVIEVAQPASGEVGFTYLENAKGTVQVHAGDGRMLLAGERDRDEPLYDVLIVDAFTGGNVPAHLLTREAFELYASRLRRDGLLALHTSNHVLDLRPAVYAGAEHLGAQAAFVRNRSRDYSRDVKGHPHISMHADWVLVWWDDAVTIALRDQLTELVTSGELTVQRADQVRFEVRGLLTDDRLGVWHLRQGRVREQLAP